MNRTCWKEYIVYFCDLSTTLSCGCIKSKDKDRTCLKFKTSLVIWQIDWEGRISEFLWILLVINHFLIHFHEFFQKLVSMKKCWFLLVALSFKIIKVSHSWTFSGFVDSFIVQTSWNHVPFFGLLFFLKIFLFQGFVFLQYVCLFSHNIK